MAKFTLNDFISDDIPECLLRNSKMVKQMLREGFSINDEIEEIKLVGIVYQGYLIHEWQVISKNKDRPMPVFPVFLPENIEQAARLAAIHFETKLEDLPTHTYSINDYLLIGGKHPCQLILGEDNELYLKRIVMFASQVQVQTFLQQTLNLDLVTAALVVINKHNFCYKGLQDICWLINMNGIPSLMSMDRRFLNIDISVIDNFEEFPIDTIFDMDGQKYIVTADEDNGEFIAKISSRQARKYQEALQIKTTNTEC